MRGIDVSKWQKGLDTNKIDNIDFVIAKATGGTGYIDPCTADFYAQSVSSNRLFGFYHFACDGYGLAGGAEEAKFFYEHTKQYIGKGIPILDLEDDRIPDWAMYTLEFLNTYERLSGVRPIVYTGLKGITDLDAANLLYTIRIWFAGYPLGYIGYWLPDGTSPREFYAITENANIIMWQFTSAIDYQGFNVDSNLCYINREDWKVLEGGEMQLTDGDMRQIAKYTAEEIFNREFPVNGSKVKVPFWQLVSWAYFYVKEIFNKAKIW